MVCDFPFKLILLRNLETVCDVGFFIQVHLEIWRQLVVCDFPFKLILLRNLETVCDV